MPFDADTPLAVAMKQKLEAPKDPRKKLSRSLGSFWWVWIEDDISGTGAMRAILECLADPKVTRGARCRFTRFSESGTRVEVTSPVSPPLRRI